MLVSGMILGGGSVVHVELRGVGGGLSGTLVNCGFVG